MTEPDLDGRGVPSASRRKFLWLGGGVAASLLLLPDSSLAAKVASAVKRASSKAGARAGSGRRTGSGATAGKGAPKGARAGTAAKRGSGAGKGTSKVAAGKTAATRSTTTARRSVTRSGVASSRVQRPAYAAGGEGSARTSGIGATSRLESPPAFSPGRAFSFGAGPAQVRDLSLYNIHTGERVELEYYVDGRYEPDALRAFDTLLRDYHTDEVCQFDPRVLNQLYELRNALGSRETFHVCSGYRSPTTNESYRRAGARVAEHSYHMTGQAIDVYLPGRDIRQLRNVALAMRAGGVGYYPSDGFVHLDSGPVRRW
jgi:uncharacterized protein YcbK (DUF882 family)